MSTCKRTWQSRRVRWRQYVERYFAGLIASMPGSVRLALYLTLHVLSDSMIPWLWRFHGPDIWFYIFRFVLWFPESPASLIQLISVSSMHLVFVKGARANERKQKNHMLGAMKSMGLGQQRFQAKSNSIRESEETRNQWIRWNICKEMFNTRPKIYAVLSLHKLTRNEGFGRIRESRWLEQLAYSPTTSYAFTDKHKN